LNVAEHGSIVVLEMLNSDYSLAEISGIVESEMLGCLNA
jgi:hypothetical protein